MFFYFLSKFAVKKGCLELDKNNARLYVIILKEVITREYFGFPTAYI